MRCWGWTHPPRPRTPCSVHADGGEHGRGCAGAAGQPRPALSVHPGRLGRVPGMAHQLAESVGAPTLPPCTAPTKLPCTSPTHAASPPAAGLAQPRSLHSTAAPTHSMLRAGGAPYACATAALLGARAAGLLLVCPLMPSAGREAELLVGVSPSGLRLAQGARHHPWRVWATLHLLRLLQASPRASAHHLPSPAHSGCSLHHCRALHCEQPAVQHPARPAVAWPRSAFVAGPVVPSRPAHRARLCLQPAAAPAPWRPAAAHGRLLGRGPQGGGGEA